MTNSNNFYITSSSDGFGATSRGILLNGELSTAQVTTVIDALNQYGVVSFPDQDFTPCSLENFSRRLGEFGDDPYVQSMEGLR
jgi:alpha-ketoglutarate-dependent taurine dioxygenase